MSAYNVVRVIVVMTAMLLIALFLSMARLWPPLAGHDGRNLAIALPFICGLAIVAPPVVKSVLKR